VSQEVAGMCDVKYHIYLQEAEMYICSGSCLDQKCTLCLVVPESRDVQSLNLLMRPEMYNLSRCCWEHKFTMN